MPEIQELITEHIDIWTSAIKNKKSVGRGSSKKLELVGIKKLRELILELAIRGKLVPQDSNDEPAAILLEKIAVEKEELVKEKKIKKQKDSPKISDEEKYFKLPNGWEWDRIGNIGNIFNGNSISKHIKEEKYTHVDGLPYIATKDVGYGFDKLEYDNDISIPVNEPKFKIAHTGTVLICAEGGSAGKKCGIADRDICFGNKLFALELWGKIKSKYILSTYLTPIFYTYFSKSMTGIIGGISANKFSNLLMPLPPLAEQSRIVAKIDELMALCDQLEHKTEQSITAHQTLVDTLLNTLVNPDQDAIAFADSWKLIEQNFELLFTTERSIDKLKQSILQLAVMGKLVPQDPNDEPASILLEKISVEKERLIKEKKINRQKALPKISTYEELFNLPMGWESVRLDEIVDITSGITKGRKLAGKKLVSVEYLRVANVQRSYLDLVNMKSIEIPEDEVEKFSVKKRDLLITEGGDWDKVGRTAIWNEELAYVAHQNHIFKARLILQEQNEIWLEKYLNSVVARNYFASSSKQTTNLASINKTQLRGCIIVIPPEKEQKRIISMVDNIMIICDKLSVQVISKKIIQQNLWV